MKNLWCQFLEQNDQNNGEILKEQKVKANLEDERHDTQYNRTQYNDTEHTGTRYKETQRHGTQRNDNEHNNIEHNDTGHKLIWITTLSIISIGDFRHNNIP